MAGQPARVTGLGLIVLSMSPSLSRSVHRPRLAAGLADSMRRGRALGGAAYQRTRLWRCGWSWGAG